MSGHILVVARTRIRRMYYRGFYVIRLVDSVCVPSTCSFLRCSATCSAVGKEWSHFGHVKPVSDMTSDWTILNKKHASVCYSIVQVAQPGTLVFFSLYTYQTRSNNASSSPAIMVNGTEYSVKNYGLLESMSGSPCVARPAAWDRLNRAAINAYCFRYKYQLALWSFSLWRETTTPLQRNLR